jgi:hypothetical protein
MNMRAIKKKNMKGQFFLIGGFLVLLLFYTGISTFFSPGYSQKGIKGEMANFFSNIKDEYPAALNLGLNSTGGAQALVNFTDIVINATKGRGASLAALWILTHNSSDNLNVTIGNYMGAALNVTLNVSGSLSTLEIGGGETASVVFASPLSELDFRASFNTTEKNLLLEKYKTNLYVFLEMKKGSDKITGETVA